ncbi:MAG TPA: UDP-glucose 4-epimerase GalE [Candidatus Solibacter sp.]|jgi:UDP-glucose 4-epimerase|nr:UDP-glucose 4-epimerase GalE [Candidatus Solibacter sp.]
MKGSILVTGGAGFIGSHTCLALVEAGYEVSVVDNLRNSHPGAVERVEQLSGQPVRLHVLDLLDVEALEGLFRGSHFDGVIHFAGLKCVSESIDQPLDYWYTNVGATTNLLRAMERHGVGRLVFSSSATVYDPTSALPFREDNPLSPINPYGRSKLTVERILGDLATAGSPTRSISLRYFNPVGAHESGTLGEDPLGTPNNLMPIVMRVAVGRLPYVTVFGDDYPTADGTCVRDYIHVMDVADAHVRALGFLESAEGHTAVNLGTGQGSSVFEVLDACAAAVGRPIAHRVGPRRPGDAPVSFADPSLALKLLGWRAERDLSDMCADSYRWQAANPAGFGSPFPELSSRSNS